MSINKEAIIKKVLEDIVERDPSYPCRYPSSYCKLCPVFNPCSSADRVTRYNLAKKILEEEYTCTCDQYIDIEACGFTYQVCSKCKKIKE